MNKRNYSFGVYYYVDSETGLIDYIGFDSHIDSTHNRDYQHLNWKPRIKFDEILQKNPDRWKYHVFKKFDTLEDASQCEYDLVNLYRPRFNFKHGGVNGGKFYQDFEYTVVKDGKNGFKICNRSRQPIKSCKDKSKLEPLATALNNGEITEAEVRAIDFFEYTVVKAGSNGFTICDRSHYQIKTCKDKSKLEPIAVALNNGEITEKEAKAIDFFEYTVVKAGSNGFTICDRSHYQIKTCKDKSKLEPIAVALNNGKITDEEVKVIRGVNKVLEILKR